MNPRSDGGSDWLLDALVTIASSNSDTGDLNASWATYNRAKIGAALNKCCSREDVGTSMAAPIRSAVVQRARDDLVCGIAHSSISWDCWGERAASPVDS